MCLRKFHMEAERQKRTNKTQGKFQQLFPPCQFGEFPAYVSENANRYHSALPRPRGFVCMDRSGLVNRPIEPSP